ncbi:putative DNA-binding ribbon-helix-helix protein [Microbacterium sp. 1154]|uniref:hypothetical protein n=1 Tax=Microbacterium sp. 1154 TaxID=2817733 RepID=UPI0028546D2A|nr:hypothetical protein [Microbacterium sp. 1154]MDR6692540.1 putative DNA-binding ribbon-helix-helix protein [Microbacterium sp. 1154]
MAPRLPRNTRHKPVTAGWEIEESTRERIKAIAEQSGMSAGALIDQLAQHMPLDERGRAIWLPPVPLKDGELPIDSA